MARIARITSETAHFLSHVADDVFDAPIQHEHLSAMLATGTHILIVALESETVVGQCLGIVHHAPDRPPELYVDNLGVTPDCRRQGIGTALMQAVYAEGRDAGCATCWLGADPDSDTALPFYTSLGPKFRHATFAEFSLI